MSPLPRLFCIEVEVTVVQAAHYYVYSHDEETAEEILTQLLKERVRDRQTEVINNDDVSMDDVVFGSPRARTLKIIDFDLVTDAEEVKEETHE
tara:strand:- start:100 stop:378 length:279 start_codon:yes stop_codon:yes gene_type:complete